LTPNSIGVIYWPRPMHLRSWRTNTLWVVVIVQEPFLPTRSMWRWPLTKINRRHIRTCLDKFTFAVWGQRDHGLSSYWSETVFTYNVYMTLTLNPMIPKLIGVIYRPRPMHLWSLKVKVPSVVELSIGNYFGIQGQIGLDLWLYDPKTIGVIFFVMNNPNTKFEIPRSKRSLVIDRKPTEGPTTDNCKAIYTHYLKGGIIIK
jgi:hypothetical protein